MPTTFTGSVRHLIKFTDNISLSESFVKQTLKSLSDNPALTESFIKLTIRSLSDNVSLSEAIAKLTNTMLSDNISLSEAIAKLTTLTAFSDNITLTESIATTILNFARGIKLDISDIIDEIGENVTLTTTAYTLDSQGNVLTATDTSDTGVTVIFEDIKAEDLQHLGQGEFAIGSARMDAKYRYDLANNGNNYQIKTGDQVKRTFYDGTNRYDATYRVEKIVSEDEFQGTVVSYVYLVNLIETTVTADATSPSSGLEFGFRIDFASILSDIGEGVTITHLSETLDSMGNVLTTTETTDSDVSVIISDLTLADRQMLGSGISLNGVSKMYAKHNYDLSANGNDYQIKTGDRIQTRNKMWNVDQIISKNIINYGPDYIAYLIKRIDS